MHEAEVICEWFFSLKRSTDAEEYPIIQYIIKTRWFSCVLLQFATDPETSLGREHVLTSFLIISQSLWLFYSNLLRLIEAKLSQYYKTKVESGDERCESIRYLLFSERRNFLVATCFAPHESPSPIIIVIFKLRSEKMRTMFIRKLFGKTNFTESRRVE